MPSPLAHLSVAYVIQRVLRKRGGAAPAAPPWGAWKWLAATAVLSLLPDLDAVPGLLLHNMHGYHNAVTHTPAAALMAAAIVGLGVRLLRRGRPWFWFGLTLLCYAMHLFLDLFCFGRGMMLLWPFSSDRTLPPFFAFFGFHWSSRWNDRIHLWTVLNETVFAAVVIALVHAFTRSKRTKPPADAAAR